MVRTHLFAVYHVRCEYVNVVSFGRRGVCGAWFRGRWLCSPTLVTNRRCKEPENSKQANGSDSRAHGSPSILVDCAGLGFWWLVKLILSGLVVALFASLSIPRIVLRAFLAAAGSRARRPVPTGLASGPRSGSRDRVGGCPACKATAMV